jgi:hypothetical protein
MIDRLISLLPLALQRLIRPELEDIVSTFTKTNAKLERFAARAAAEAARDNELAAALIAQARSRTAGVDTAKRVAARLAAMLD